MQVEDESVKVGLRREDTPCISKWSVGVDQIAVKQMFYICVQLVHLLELMEIRMIWDVRKRVASEMSLSAAESVREETALPTDLWKHAVWYFLS